VDIKYRKIGFSQNKQQQNMPYSKVMIHLIWSTKNREPYITRDLKPLLLAHIKENSIKKNIFIDTINCTSDHIHLLISLGIEQSFSKVVMLLKGESSFWVNQQKLSTNKFEWQDEYIAVSISRSHIDMIRDYIKNQEEHHNKHSFNQEYETFMKEYGINVNSLG
jgi:putative transposase